MAFSKPLSEFERWLDHRNWDAAVEFFAEKVLDGHNELAGCPEEYQNGIKQKMVEIDLRRREIATRQCIVQVSLLQGKQIEFRELCTEKILRLKETIAQKVGYISQQFFDLTMGTVLLRNAKSLSDYGCTPGATYKLEADLKPLL